MKKLELADATAPLAEYARQVAGAPILITTNGEPLAVLVPPEDVDLESLLLATSPWFLAILERSRRRDEAEGGISLEEVRRRLGLEKEPTHKPRRKLAAPAKRGPQGK